MFTTIADVVSCSCTTIDRCADVTTYADGAEMTVLSSQTTCTPVADVGSYNYARIERCAAGQAACAAPAGKVWPGRHSSPAGPSMDSANRSWQKPNCKACDPSNVRDRSTHSSFGGAIKNQNSASIALSAGGHPFMPREIHASHLPRSYLCTRFCIAVRHSFTPISANSA